MVCKTVKPVNNGMRSAKLYQASDFTSYHIQLHIVICNCCTINIGGIYTTQSSIHSSTKQNKSSILKCNIIICLCICGYLLPSDVPTVVSTDCYSVKVITTLNPLNISQLLDRYQHHYGVSLRLHCTCRLYNTNYSCVVYSK